MGLSTPVHDPFYPNRVTDHAGRCMASRWKSFIGISGSITYTETLASYKYEYDANNNLTNLHQSVDGNEWNVIYTYDADNRPETVKLNNDVVITAACGSVTGRYDKTTIALGNKNEYVTDVLYASGAEGSQITLVSIYQNAAMIHISIHMIRTGT